MSFPEDDAPEHESDGAPSASADDDSRSAPIRAPRGKGKRAESRDEHSVSDGSPKHSLGGSGSGGTMDVRATDLEYELPPRPSSHPDRSDPEMLVTAKVGEYRLLDRIGAGGCSSVYAAVDEKTGDKVALKVLRAGLAGSRRQVQRFVQEARAVQRIKHPCVVPVYETGELADGRPYMIMELIDGESLTQILYRRGRMSPGEALMVLRPVCEALALAHEVGIVHRDIKAGNIMIEGDLERPVVRLLDFGIAKLLTSDSGETLKTSMGRVVGTPQSMAPEQILGHPVTGRTDIYALGILLFRMLTGRHPYASPDAQVIVQMHMTAPPPKSSDFAPTSRSIDEVIARAMAKDPSQRYQSPRELIEAFERAMQTEESYASTPRYALALYVDARIPSEGELDDNMLDDLMSALDAAEYLLREAGYTIVLETSEAVLGALVLDEESAAAELPAARDRAIELADAVRHELVGIAGESIHFNVCVHEDRALVRQGSHGPPGVSGPITDIGGWAPVAEHDGVWTSFARVASPSDGGGEPDGA